MLTGSLLAPAREFASGLPVGSAEEGAGGWQDKPA